MAQTAIVSSKGQVVIPAQLRKKFNLGPRTKVVFGELNGKLTMESTALNELLALRGSLAHVKEDVEAWWIKEKHKERVREDAKIEESL
jgi:AbrB family looped-hinge helix DNA binding protein